MKRFATAALIAATATATLTTNALAGSYEVRCSTESVPYQETIKGGSPEEVIGGALIGGLLGGVATDEEAGAVVGAIIGGALANENSSQTVTRYRDVETCSNVFIPDRVTDVAYLEDILRDLNAGRTVSKELTMDVQYTIGVGYDGVWGPKSRAAAEEYLASLAPEAPVSSQTLFSLVVNNVVIVSSPDVAAIDEIRDALAEAGVPSQIFVDLQ